MKQEWTKLVEKYVHRACALELSPTQTARVLKPKMAELRKRGVIDGFTCTVTEKRVELSCVKMEGKSARRLSAVICTDVELERQV